LKTRKNIASSPETSGRLRRDCSPPGRLDLDDVGAQPAPELGARGAGLELGEVEDPHSAQRALAHGGASQDIGRHLYIDGVCSRCAVGGRATIRA
jgi:hypothetical protein